ncbi:MAG: alpha/beta fold hydrolase [Deltaproteobacteria bacterium]|nr:alpha/beta fold hydrolase [Deltaproteobacteria bacterium]MBK8240294.1 alpha/beta fold hydrolase [Deltaproteobacteria bacterium]MBP7291564.1 alpha/beta fold hydrolase [Nannocystaceae bacterium]
MSVAAAQLPAGNAVARGPRACATIGDRPHSRTVEVAANRWHLLEMGQGPVALLLHGAGASSHSCVPLMQRLAPAFTVLAPDLPGHARSSFAPSFDPTLPNVVAAMRELVRALGLQPQLLIGHSAGAAIATRLALDGVVSPSLLVGLAPALVPFRGLAAAVLPPAAALLSGSRASALLAACFATSQRIDRVLRGTGSVLDPAGVESYRELVARPEHVAGVLSMMSRWSIDELYDDLSTLAIPCLLVAGRNDLAVPLSQVREAAARLRHARVAVVDDVGHLLHEEQPDRISALILEHLDRPLDP